MATRTPKAGLTRETDPWRQLFDDVDGIADHLLEIANIYGPQDVDKIGAQLDRLQQKAQKLRNKKPKAPQPNDKERFAGLVLGLLREMNEEDNDMSGADFLDEVVFAADNCGLLPRATTGEDHGV